MSFSFIQETAINIGYSCKLLTEEMEEVFVIDAEEMEDVKKQLTEARDRMLQIKREFHLNDSTEAQHNGMEVSKIHSSVCGELCLVNEFSLIPQVRGILLVLSCNLLI